MNLHGIPYKAGHGDNATPTTVQYSEKYIVLANYKNVAMSAIVSLLAASAKSEAKSCYLNDSSSLFYADAVAVMIYCIPL